MANVPAVTHWTALAVEPQLSQHQQRSVPPARATRSSSRLAATNRSPAKPQARVSIQSIWSQHDAKTAAAAAEMMAAMDVETEHLGSLHQQQQPQQHQLLGAATSSLAKFKAEQDLKIQTENLPQTPTAAGTSSTSSSTSTFTTPGTDTSSCATPETPAPPSSTGKKRRRRTANQIDRKFACNYPSCSKAYGSEGSLTQHQRLKHDGVVLPKPSKASTSTQIGSYFPPLHQTARSSGAATATSASGSVPLPRAPLTATRTIRPATMEGLALPVMAFEMAAPPGSGGVLLGAASAPSSAARPRQNQRSRSNSMPVSVSAPAAPVLTKHLSTSSCMSSAGGGSAPRPQAARKSRVSCTPRAKSGAASATNRRVKCRSKSETLSDVNFFTAIGDESPLPPRSNRSVSESFVISSHHDPFVVPMSLASSSTSGSVTSENVQMPSHANTLHHSHSFDWSSSMTSDSPSSDQAIDSDILSVLADYDSSSDIDDSSTELADCGPLSSGSFRGHASSYDESDDGDMLMTPVGLESYAFAPEPPGNPPTLATTGLRINDLFRRAEELGVGSRGVDLKTAFATTKHEAWPGLASTGRGGSLEAGYLSTHMEKMSMLQHQQQQQQLPVSTAPERVPPMGLSGRMGGLEDFACVSADAFAAVKAAPDDLEPESMEICEPDVKDEIFPLEILDDSVGVGGAAVGGMWKSAGSTISSSDSSVVASSVAMAPLEPGVLGVPSATLKLEPADLEQHPSQWTKSFASTASWAALEAQNQYVDELFQEAIARNPRERKVHKKMGANPDVFMAHRVGAHSLQGEKLVGHAEVASGTSLSDLLLFGTPEYGLEDTRMGSPLLCQHEEL